MRWSKGGKLALAKALELYYEMNGLDKETGAPVEGKLVELGIGWAAALLQGKG